MLVLPLQVQLLCTASFDCLGGVYSVLAKYAATAGEEQYTDSGRVRLRVTADVDAVQPLTSALADASSGRVKVQQLQQPEGSSGG